MPESYHSPEGLAAANLDDALAEKWQRLLDDLAGMGSALVAYSGGVDSTLLAWAARQSLGEKMLAVTLVTGLDSQAQVEQTASLARGLNLPHQTVTYDALKVAGIRENSPERCFHCKEVMLARLHELARAEGYTAVLEGQNLDDEGEDRPGRLAVLQSGTLSPLLRAGLTKHEIRALARAFDLPVWDLPSTPCLATRVPFGTPLDAELLRQVALAEEVLHRLGFRVARVRHHGSLARIEVPLEDIPALLEKSQQISAEFQQLGFNFTCVDMQGYRSGSMNEGLA